MSTSWDDVKAAAAQRESTDVMNQRGSGVNWDDRAKISFETDPNAQAGMLRSYGYDSVRVASDGRLIVTDKQGIDRYVDPGTFEFSDLADLAGDVPGFAGEVAGGVLGAGGGVPGAMAGAGLGGALGDAVRQGIAGQLGSERGYDVGQTAEAGAWGAAGEGAEPGS